MIMVPQSNGFGGTYIMIFCINGYKISPESNPADSIDDLMAVRRKSSHQKLFLKRARAL